MIEISDSGKGKGARRKAARRKGREPVAVRVLNYEKIIDGAIKVKPKYLNLSLFITVMALSCFGLMMIYSASSYNAQIYFGNKYYYLSKQLIGFVLGVVALGFTYFVDYEFYRKKAWIFLGIGIAALLLVFVPGIGIEKLGARRWIGVGGFSIQPSEIAKFCFVIFAAGILSRTEFVAGKFSTMLKVFAAGGVLCALVLAEPNLSITLCIGVTMFCMLFLCGTKMRHLGIILLPVLVLLPVLLISEPYRVRRLVAFVDPWATPKAEGFQLIQSLYSLGNGGLFGVGYLRSTQKYMFLPFSESDFIFSIVGEEFGFVGCFIFIATLGFLIWSIFKVGMDCRDRFGKFLCYGIGSVIFIQSVINLAVVTGSVPPTGLPLPFISFGGTSLAVFLAAVGIVLNVDKRNKLFAGQSKQIVGGDSI